MNVEDRQKSRARGGTIGAAGRRRAIELAAQDARDRAQLLAELLADHATRHGRPATASEKVPLENIATGMIRVRRLEAQGRSSIEERRMIAQWWRAAGFKVDKPAPPSPADRAAAFRAEMLRLATQRAPEPAEESANMTEVREVAR
jgi:hypothetical protein